MKILHLYSDWKWTGPAEPVLQMCKSLQDRGHEVLIAHCRNTHEAEETVGNKVAEYDLNGTEEFALDRHIPPLKSVQDLLSLPRFITREKFDVVHMHLTHDHALGALVCRLLGARRPIMVRTLHKRTVLQAGIGSKLLLKHFADGLLTFTEGFRQSYMERFNLPPERVAVQPMPIDLKRFRPDRKLRDMRREYDIPASAPVIGIVGRYQKYRRAEIFLQAAALLLRQFPETRFLVIGRSSQMLHTVVEPMQQLGIENRVILPGYRIDDYDDTIGCLDIFSLLIPGFDGTARAVREAMAMRKPCVVSDFGMLPDIVPHEKAGLVVPLDAEKLAAAWQRLLSDPELRDQLAEGAYEHAHANFRLQEVGSCLETFYQNLLGMKE